MDIIFIEDLRLEARIGIHPREKAVPQMLMLDIRMGVASTAPAGASDDIRDTVDYAAVCARLRAELPARHFNLLETLAEFAAALILESFPVQWVRLSIAKPGALPEARRVGVLIERAAAQTDKTTATISDSGCPTTVVKKQQKEGFSQLFCEKARFDLRGGGGGIMRPVSRSAGRRRIKAGRGCRGSPQALSPSMKIRFPVAFGGIFPSLS
jgi:dihydroneopterin aldolase